MARGSSFDVGSILKFGAIGVGGYFLWKWYSDIGPTPTATSIGTQANTGFNSLDQIAARIMAAAGTGTSFTADQWDVYLQAQLPAGKVAPDPAGFIGATPRETGMTFAQYWGAVSPKLKSDLGLSGLGVFGGLGMVKR